MEGDESGNTNAGIDGCVRNDPMQERGGDGMPEVPLTGDAVEPVDETGQQERPFETPAELEVEMRGNLGTIAGEGSTTNVPRPEEPTSEFGQTTRRQGLLEWIQ